MIKTNTAPKRIFSGVQPTGNLTLGNYLGALRHWVELQKSHACIYCVVDMHAITIWQEPAKLRHAIRAVAASIIACGIDTEKHILFNQSQNPAHAELGWIFNCVARIGWLNRMTQFKDKAGKDSENASAGLFVYPNLMAADILAYKADFVPVGADQKQHLELTRDIAAKFNHDWQRPDFFTEPQPLILGTASRVMSLRDATRKMSKSDASDYSRINLSDDQDQIAQKIRKAKTDPEALPSEIAGLENRLEAKNLVGIYAALRGIDITTTLGEIGGKSFRDFKQDLTNILVDTITPIGAEIARLLDDPVHIDRVLREGGVRARQITDPILKEVYEIIGLVR